MTEAFSKVWGVEKMLKESPRDTEKRILKALARLQRLVRDPYKLPKEPIPKKETDYLAAAGYVNYLMTDGKCGYKKYMESEGKITTREKTYAAITTSKGEEALARERLHNIDRTIINIIRERIRRAAKEESSLAIDEDNLPIQFL